MPSKLGGGIRLYAIVCHETGMSPAVIHGITALVHWIRGRTVIAGAERRCLSEAAVPSIGCVGLGGELRV